MRDFDLDRTRTGAGHRKRKTNSETMRAVARTRCARARRCGRGQVARSRTDAKVPQIPTIGQMFKQQKVKSLIVLRSYQEYTELCLVQAATDEQDDKDQKKKREALRRQGEEEQQESIRERNNLEDGGGDSQETLDENEKKHHLSLPGRKKNKDENKSEGQKEKEETMEKANADPEPNARKFKGQGDREVYDPVTGRTVWIRDAKLQGEAGSPLSPLSNSLVQSR